MRKEKNNIIKKANKLIESRYNLGINEQKILYYLISKIKVSDKEFREYKIKTIDLINFLSIKNQRIYEDMQKYFKKLMQQVLILKEDENDILIHWLTTAKFNNRKNEKSQPRNDLS